MKSRHSLSMRMDAGAKYLKHKCHGTRKMRILCPVEKAEYNFLIQVKKGKLIKKDDSDDRYDATDDFEYDRLEQYG